MPVETCEPGRTLLWKKGDYRNTMQLRGLDNLQSLRTWLGEDGEGAIEDGTSLIVAAVEFSGERRGPVRIDLTHGCHVVEEFMFTLYCSTQPHTLRWGGLGWGIHDFTGVEQLTDFIRGRIEATDPVLRLTSWTPQVEIRGNGLAVWPVDYVGPLVGCHSYDGNVPGIMTVNFGGDMPAAEWNQILN